MTESVTLQRDYPYPPGRLFEAWTDVHLLGQWFGCGTDMLWTVHEWDVRPGGAIRVSLAFDTGRYEVTGQFLEVVPPRRLRYRWQGEQIVDVTIEPLPTGSRLTVQHIGLDHTECDVVSAGWTSGLDQLDRALSEATWRAVA